MKGIKKFYSEHRIFTILMALVIVCLILIATVLIQCFYVGKGHDKYGNRLEGIKEHELASDTLTDVKDKLVQEGIVSQANISIEGKIVYIKIIFTPEADLISAEGIAQKSLEYFGEDALGYYDINFTLSKSKTDDSDGFLIEGTHNSHGSGLSWNLNRPIVEEAVIGE